MATAADKSNSDLKADARLTFDERLGLERSSAESVTKEIECSGVPRKAPGPWSSPRKTLKSWRLYFVLCPDPRPWEVKYPGRHSATLHPAGGLLSRTSRRMYSMTV